MKVIYFNVLENASPEVLEIENEIEVFYKHIKSDALDITTRVFNGKEYVIICDDMGYLRKGELKVSIFQKDNEGYPIVGNVIISKFDNNGDLTDLSEDDIKNIFSTHKFFISFENGIANMVFEVLTYD